MNEWNKTEHTHSERERWKKKNTFRFLKFTCILYEKRTSQTFIYLFHFFFYRILWHLRSLCSGHLTLAHRHHTQTHIVPEPAQHHLNHRYTFRFISRVVAERTQQDDTHIKRLWLVEIVCSSCSMWNDSMLNDIVDEHWAVRAHLYELWLCHRCQRLVAVSFAFKVNELCTRSATKIFIFIK